MLMCDSFLYQYQSIIDYRIHTKLVIV